MFLTALGTVVFRAICPRNAVSNFVIWKSFLGCVEDLPKKEYSQK